MCAGLKARRASGGGKNKELPGTLPHAPPDSGELDRLRLFPGEDSEPSGAFRFAPVISTA